MTNIKKFTDYIKKFKKKSIDSPPIDNKLPDFKFTPPFKKENSLEKIKDDDITIIGIQDISLEDPRIENPALIESMVISGDLSGKDVKRGDIIWVTALIKKGDYNLSSMCVIKTRIIDLYQGMSALSNIK